MFKFITDAIDKARQNREAARQREELARQQEQEYAASLRRGQLPTVNSKLMLNADELCFLETSATYTRQLKAGPKVAEGRLTVTSTRVLFTTPNGEGSWKINLDNVMEVKGEGSRFNLQTGAARGSGAFATQSRHAGVILEAAAKLSKRLMVMSSDGGETKTRRIPQEVKVAVWQRDQGKCVECGATEYLEFDHIIPFSKGGANTVGNLQLLCRNCNLKKGSRI